MFRSKRKPRKIPLSVPGPSPWYLRAPTAAIKTPEGLWTWDSYDDDQLAGISRLISPGGMSVLFLEFYCYVLPLKETEILIWYEKGRDTKEAAEPPGIEFIKLDMASLRQFEEHESASRRLRDAKGKVYFEGVPIGRFRFNSAVPKGTHNIGAPKEFSELGEILVLADYGPVESTSNYYDKMYRAIFAFRFGDDRVEVIPQEWFNEGNYDFGYQWVTRVERNLDSGRIFGEGIRLGNFELDDSAAQIKEWLEEDVFYHPERQ